MSDEHPFCEIANLKQEVYYMKIFFTYFQNENQRILLSLYNEI